MALVTSVASAQSLTLLYEVEITNGPSYDLKITDGPDGKKVYYDGVYHPAAYWYFDDDNNVHIEEGQGHAILKGAAHVDVGATGDVQDGNTSPPTKAGEWERKPNP